MSRDKSDEIIKLLNELIDLVKKNGQNKVENHTHHHYPTPPTYNYPRYPYWWQGYTSTSGAAITPGTTTTFSTNDPGTNGPVNPTA